MTLFFLVVGLEAKRELDLGELRERTRLAIPVVAALGGMAAAAGASTSRSTRAATAPHGWGAAVSTDTALALGALALLTRGRAIRLRVFLLTLVVIDDLVALLVIALGYTEHVSVTALAIAIGLFGVLLALRWAASWRGAGRGAGRRRDLARDVRVGRRRRDRRPRDRAGHERLPAGARRAGAQHRADALVPRAADARARLLGAREPDARRSRPTSACSTACTRGRAA